MNPRLIRAFGQLHQAPGWRPVRDALQRRGWRSEFAIWDGLPAEFWTLYDEDDEAIAEVWIRPGCVGVVAGREFPASEIGLFAAAAEGAP